MEPIKTKLINLEVKLPQNNFDGYSEQSNITNIDLLMGAKPELYTGFGIDFNNFRLNTDFGKSVLDGDSITLGGAYSLPISKLRTSIGGEHTFDNYGGSNKLKLNVGYPFKWGTLGGSYLYIKSPYSTKNRIGLTFGNRNFNVRGNYTHYTYPTRTANAYSVSGNARLGKGWDSTLTYNSNNEGPEDPIVSLSFRKTF